MVWWFGGAVRVGLVGLCRRVECDCGEGTEWRCMPVVLVMVEDNQSTFGRFGERLGAVVT